VALAIGILFLGAAGVIALEGVTGAPIALVFAFGSAALLYLVTEQPLVKAQEVPETPTSTTFFVGFPVVFPLDMLH